MAKKAGRKRNIDSDRYPNGQTRPPTEDEIKNVARFPRLKELAGKSADDRRWGTQLGRLHWQGKLFEPQLLAGERLAEVVEKFRALKYPMPNHQRVSSPEQRSPGEATDPPDHVIKAIEDDYDGYFKAVLEVHRGVELWKALMNVCVQDLAPAGYQELKDLRAGLDVLSLEMGLTTLRRIG